MTLPLNGLRERALAAESGPTQLPSPLPPPGCLPRRRLPDDVDALSLKVTLLERLRDPLPRRTVEAELPSAGRTEDEADEELPSVPRKTHHLQSPDADPHLVQANGASQNFAPHHRPDAVEA